MKQNKVKLYPGHHKPDILTTEHREEPWDCVKLSREPNDRVSHVV